VVLPFEVKKGEPVDVRLTALGAAAAADGRATVAWASHGTPCRAGLCFNDAMAEQVVAVIRALLGAVPIETEEEVA
jgi:DNA-binding LacI/PurR family transcriptional regulator